MSQHYKHDFVQSFHLKTLMSTPENKGSWLIVVFERIVVSMSDIDSSQRGVLSPVSFTKPSRLLWIPTSRVKPGSFLWLGQRNQIFLMKLEKFSLLKKMFYCCFFFYVFCLHFWGWDRGRQFQIVHLINNRGFVTLSRTACRKRCVVCNIWRLLSVTKTLLSSTVHPMFVIRTITIVPCSSSNFFHFRDGDTSSKVKGSPPDTRSPPDSTASSLPFTVEITARWKHFPF